MIAFLFNDSFENSKAGLFGGARRAGLPTIQSILKLENKTVQANFMNELKKQFDKYRGKAPS